jgi:hypothetical protein
MTKLNENQIQALEEYKKNGGVYVYKTIRKHFDSWYVRLFHVDNLLEEKVIPSYWYKGRGDCTMRQAEKQGYKCLCNNWIG